MKKLKLNLFFTLTSVQKKNIISAKMRISGYTEILTLNSLFLYFINCFTLVYFSRKNLSIENSHFLGRN